MAPRRGGSCAPPRHTPAPHPGRGGRHRKHLHHGERRLHDGQRRPRSVVTHQGTHHTPKPQCQARSPGMWSSYTCPRGHTQKKPGKGGRRGGHTCVQPCMKGGKNPPSRATSYSRSPPRRESGPARAPPAPRRQMPSKPSSPATKASCTPTMITHGKATPCGGSTLSPTGPATTG